MTLAANIDFQVFALFLEARRIHRRRSEPRLAREAGVSVEVVRRATSGRRLGEKSYRALCQWMRLAPEFFARPGTGVTP